jgi:hypothetical protein
MDAGYNRHAGVTRIFDNYIAHHAELYSKTRDRRGNRSCLQQEYVR